MLPLVTHLPSPFSSTFGLPFPSSAGTNCVQALSAVELFSCCSASSAVMDHLSLDAASSDYMLFLSLLVALSLWAPISLTT
jgi:hypothetical protein